MDKDYIKKNDKKYDSKTGERIIKQDGKTYRSRWEGDDWVADKDWKGDPEIERDAQGNPKIERDAQGNPKIERDWKGDPIVSGGDDEDGCFIATAAYGTPLVEEVKSLRDLRDQYLINNRAGRFLVRLYYRHSPKVADFIRDNEPLKRIVRAGLRPAIWLSKFMVERTNESN